MRMGSILKHRVEAAQDGGVVDVPGEPEHLVSGGGERGVLGAVGAEGGQGAVSLPAVGLDDEAVRRPVEVGLALAVVGGREAGGW
jgi:hypothetical protein